MDTYYDYEVEAAYMPSDKDYRDWTEHLRAAETEENSHREKTKMTIKRDSKYVAIEQALNAVRLGEPRDFSLDPTLRQKGLAHYVGGELFITAKGREWLNGVGR